MPVLELHNISITASSQTHAHKQKIPYFSPPAHLFTNSNPLFHRTSLTLNSATPMELAVASFRSSVPLQIVTASAAQCATAIRRCARPVASSAHRSCHIKRCIALAKVGRVLVVEEIERELFFGSLRVFVWEEILEVGVRFLAALFWFHART